MNKKIFILIGITALGLGVGKAQSNTSLAAESLNNQAIRLSINLNNNTISVGTTFAVTAIIDNLSTNEIYFGESRNDRDFKITLIDQSGKEYRLTPELTPANELSSRMVLKKVKAGESYSSDIEVTIGKNIEPGQYLLQAKRNITEERRNIELISNSVKVTIIANQ